ncbi:unnamed protein product [Ectocarpus sp. CCAP 1310/34]|nr:unnamed protein product [Ectocarpus sp. CCAP 1310/34]
MIRKSKTREARKRPPALRRSHLLVATVMSATTVKIVESNRLVEFPSVFRCMWNDLPHPAQFAIIFLMLALLFGVHRIFGKLDDAAYARLSRAVTAWINERRHAHQG